MDTMCLKLIIEDVVCSFFLKHSCNRLNHQRRPTDRETLVVEYQAPTSGPFFMFRWTVITFSSQNSALRKQPVCRLNSVEPITAQPGCAVYFHSIYNGYFCCVLQGSSIHDHFVFILSSHVDSVSVADSSTIYNITINPIIQSNAELWACSNRQRKGLFLKYEKFFEAECFSKKCDE